MNENKEIEKLDDLKKIQEELVNREDSNYLKNKLPEDAKLRKTALSKDMAICLLFVYKHYRYTPNVSITDYFSKKVFLQYLDYPNIKRNFHKLKYWDLIQQMPTSPTEIKYKKGWYGITENGIAFVQREIAVPKFALVYNDLAYQHQTIPYLMISDLIEDEVIDELLNP